MENYLECTEIEKIIESLIQEGRVKKTGLFVLDAYDKFTLDDDSKYLIDEVKDIYLIYLKSLKNLDEYRAAFLKTLKEDEIKRNQILESVNTFLIQVYMNSRHNSATNSAIKEKVEGKETTQRSLCGMHKTLLNGLQKSNDTMKVRSSNTAIVGSDLPKNPQNIPNSPKARLSYVPIDYRDIKEAIERILLLYNQKEITSEAEIFTLPIMIHGFVASLQCFTDGNTRLARILGHVKLWELTLKYLYDIESPALFMSESIMRLDKREEYREHIKEIALNPTNESFNEWIKFNMFLLEKQIYFNQDKVRECAMVLKRVKK